MIPLCNGEHMVRRDRRTRCKHPEILTLVRKQQRYGREAHTTSPAKVRVYSSIAPLILVDGHTTYVNLVLVSLIDFVFAIVFSIVFLIVFLFEFLFFLVSVFVVHVLGLIQ